MNQTFSPTRFARLNRWLWANKGRTYLIGIGALVVVGCLNLSRVMSDADETYNVFTYQGHLIFYILTSAVLVIGMGSDVFSALFRQESAITYLMLPASRTEKFCLGVLYCLLALAVFTTIYFSYEAFAFSVANGHLKPGEKHYVSSLIFYKPDLAAGESRFIAVVYFLLLALAISVLGSFYFRKGVLVRNIGAGMLLLFGLAFLYNLIVSTQFRGLDVEVVMPFSSQYVSEEHHSQSYSLLFPAWFTYGMYVSTLLALWVIARVRFNEIER